MSGELPDTVVISSKELKVLKVDDAVNTTFVCEVKNRIGTGRAQVTAIVRGQLKDTNNTQKIHRICISRLKICDPCSSICVVFCALLHVMMN